MSKWPDNLGRTEAEYLKDLAFWRWFRSEFPDAPPTPDPEDFDPSVDPSTANLEECNKAIGRKLKRLYREHVSGN